MSRIMPHPRPKFIRELPNTQKMLSYKKTPKHGSHVFKTVLYISLLYFTHKSAQRPTEDKTVSEKIQSPVRILSNQTRATENKAKLIAW